MNKMHKLPLESEVYYRLRDISKLTNVGEKLTEFLTHFKPKQERTSQQNKALHVDCSLIAGKLNDAGIEKHEFFKQGYFIPWTTISVKDDIFRPVMKIMFKKNSTTEIEKNSNELSEIHDVIMRELGEKHGIEYHDFPYDPKKKKEMEEMMSPPKPFEDYPTEELTPKF